MFLMDVVICNTIDLYSKTIIYLAFYANVYEFIIYYIIHRNNNMEKNFFTTNALEQIKPTISFNKRNDKNHTTTKF